ncbi:MAG: hypothetical protein E7410_04140 [Ruminococcaceae bacterium]|nr:hypothetical protein [Oscillospiraceae bacterium]
MLYDLFSDFFDDGFKLFINEPQRSVPNAYCPKCNMSLAQFSKSGKLGCPDCYEAFRPYLNEVLKSIHANTEHTGKISKNANEKIKLRRELENLKKELADAIEKQNFENAALLRDKIKELEAKEGK